MSVFLNRIIAHHAGRLSIKNKNYRNSDSTAALVKNTVMSSKYTTPVVCLFRKDFWIKYYEGLWLRINCTRWHFVWMPRSYRNGRTTTYITSSFEFVNCRTTSDYVFCFIIWSVRFSGIKQVYVLPIISVPWLTRWKIY